ncbi:MAG: hypothetical protein GY811_17000 [Myxococcales bacterium]|nr:hypothetical protein [Myxococcales bacterium]
MAEIFFCNHECVIHGISASEVHKFQLCGDGVSSHQGDAAVKRHAQFQRWATDDLTEVCSDCVEERIAGRFLTLGIELALAHDVTQEQANRGVMLAAEPEAEVNSTIESLARPAAHTRLEQSAHFDS